MFNPDSRHYDFLEVLAKNQTATHEAPADIPRVDMNDMVNAGLVIEYFGQGSKTRYAIAGGGVVALSTRPLKDYKKPEGKVEDLNMDDPKTKEAIEFVVSRGYDPKASASLVAQWGVDYILESKKEVS